MARKQVKGETDQKQKTLPLTPEVRRIFTRVKKRYTKAIADLITDEDDDEDFDGNLGECQIIRSGLLMLNDAVDNAGSEDFIKLITRAKRKRGPQSENPPAASQEDNDAEVDTRLGKEAVNMATTRVS